MSVPSKLQPGERVSADDARLFNTSELAQALGVNRAFVTRMKFCGFKMPLGRSTVGRAHAWLDQNPDLLDAPEKQKSQMSAK